MAGGLAMLLMHSNPGQVGLGDLRNFQLVFGVCEILLASILYLWAFVFAPDNRNKGKCKESEHR